MTTNINSILSDLRQARQDIEDPETDLVWRENPVSLRTFVETLAYCNLPPLTPVQFDAAISVLGEDPKKIFDSLERCGINIAVLLWGKGSGKDYLTSIIHLYCIYVILCLFEPQLYFDQAPGEPLDVINVAYSGEQAKNVYFTKFLERLRRCRWFRERFNMYQSGRSIAKKNPNALGDVHIGATMVSFPGNIRAISESSENESYEGYNIIVWIMDEASAFKSAKRIENASNIYNTLKSSANTRFNNRWKGFVLSYPRSDEDWDFTIKLYKESKLSTSTNMYGSRKASWEVAPPTAYPGGKFRFIYESQEHHIEMDVPLTLKEEFEKFPERSLGMYCCMPLKSEGAFIKSAGAISKVFSDREPIFYTEPIILETQNSGETPFRSLGYRIIKWNQKEFDKSKRYVAHIDCGLNQDRAAVVIAHGEPILVELEYGDGHKEHHWIQKVVEDAHIIYEPDNKKNLRVSLNNISDILLSIFEVVPLVMVTFDRWQSASAVETLTLKGLTVKEHNINKDDYNLFRSIIYTGDIDLLRFDLTENELIQLKEGPGGNVDHPLGGSKDLADCLAGVTRLILGNNKDTKIRDSSMGSNEVAMPIAAMAYGHNSGSNSTTFNVGPNPGFTGSQFKAPKQPTTRSLPPEIPPMPFGIGTPDRERPKVRTMSDKPGTSNTNVSPYTNRIRELSR